MSMSQWEAEYHTNLIRAAETSIECVDDMIQMLLCDDALTGNVEFTKKLLVSRLNIMRNEYMKRTPALIHPLRLKDKAA